MPCNGKELDKAGEQVRVQEERGKEGNEAKRTGKSRAPLRTRDGPSLCLVPQKPHTAAVAGGSRPGGGHPEASSDPTPQSSLDGEAPGRVRHFQATVCSKGLGCSQACQAQE